MNQTHKLTVETQKNKPRAKVITIIEQKLCTILLKIKIVPKKFPIANFDLFNEQHQLGNRSNKA